MIVKMKKVTLLCLAGDRHPALERLRELRAVHLIPLAKPETEDFAAARHALDRAAGALAILATIPKGTKSPPAGPGSRPERAGNPVEQIHEAVTARRRMLEKLDALRSERMALEPYGSFDPALVEDLAGRGVVVKIFHTLSRKPVAPPENVDCFMIRQDSTGQYFALVGTADFRFDAQELPLPRRSLRDVVEEEARGNAELSQAAGDLAAMAPCKGDIERTITDLRSQLRYIEAREGMGTTAHVTYLQGFCPAPRIDALRAEAAASGWGLAIDDPADTDRVPTLIRNPVWLRPIEALFSLIKILPGYREADVSASFLGFLSLFFAMIVGDAGYGLVFFLITLIARLKLRKAPPEPFRLLFIFSVCTMIWGVITGTYFGITDKIPAPLQGVRIDWLTDNANIMNLCLLIGAIHLTVAHIWNAVRFINSLQAIAQLGWTAVTWAIFFIARTMLLGYPFPGWMTPVAVIGLVAVLLFMTPVKKLKAEWVNHVMLPLTLMSNFGDVLSYLRLFALGVAGVQLAGAFNTMAEAIGFNHVLSGLIAALILFAGHSLNIALSAISVLVHGIRLNALEFSMHFGLEWAGFAYEPFARANGEQQSDRKD